MTPENVKVLTFDIETASCWSSLSDRARAAAEASAAKRPDAQPGDAEERAALSPLTGRIVAIGMRDLSSRTTQVCYEGSGLDGIANGVRYRPCDEAEALRRFWRIVDERAPSRFARIVTFHGRGFDVPFLLLRSALHGLTPTRDLLAPLHAGGDHVDLVDVLAPQRRDRPTLELACEVFGIETPKGSMGGADVGAAVREGRLLEVARYCAEDVRAEGELYERLAPLLSIPRPQRRAFA